MSVISDYVTEYASFVSAKPADAFIDGQSASVSANGVVTIQFASSSETDIGTLRDWLDALLGEA